MNGLHHSLSFRLFYLSVPFIIVINCASILIIVSIKRDK